MAKQTNIPKLDEDFMKEVVSQGFPLKQDTTNLNERTISKENEPAIETPKIKKTVKGKQAEQTDYWEIYFEKVDFTNRQPFWLTRETHLTLLKIVNVIGGRKATLSSYLENIILQHLESHKEEINNLYENEFKRPIL